MKSNTRVFISQSTFILRMKKIILSIILVLLLTTIVSASDLSVGKSLANFPKDANWLVENEDVTGYLANLANWRITNTTDRNINLNEITLKLFGSGDDTKFLTMLYTDIEGDGVMDSPMYGAKFAPSDNATIVISFDKNFLIPAKSHKYLMIVYSKIQNRKFNEGDTFQNYLTKLKGNFVDDNSETITIAPGNGFLSSRITAINRKEYTIEVTSTQGELGWSVGEDFTEGEMIQYDAFRAEDYAFRVYEDCNIKIDHSKNLGGNYNIKTVSPTGQTFKSYSENFNAIGLNLRATLAGKEDEIIVKIRRGGIDGEILKEKSMNIIGTQYNSWYLFNFENSCQATCNNNILDEGEECEGDYLNGKVCKDIEGYYMGELTCNNCKFNTTNCYDLENYLEYYCKDNKNEGKEIDCNTLNANFKTNYVQGKYYFNQNCEVDLSECSTTLSEPNKEGEIEPVINAICGNNKKEGTEYCDGTDLGGKTCKDFGFSLGQLQCTSSCTMSTSACYNESNPNPTQPNPINDSNELETTNENKLLENEEINSDRNILIEYRDRNIPKTGNENQNTFPLEAIIIGAILLIGIVTGAIYFTKKNKKKIKKKSSKP